MVTTAQCSKVTNTLIYHTVKSAHERTKWGMVRINWYAAIGIAFSLGIRFANAHPDAARDYMARWLRDHSEDGDTTIIAIKHQVITEKIADPITLRSMGSTDNDVT